MTLGEREKAASCFVDLCALVQTPSPKTLVRLLGHRLNPFLVYIVRRFPLLLLRCSISESSAPLYPIDCCSMFLLLFHTTCSCL